MLGECKVFVALELLANMNTESQALVAPSLVGEINEEIQALVAFKQLA